MNIPFDLRAFMAFAALLVVGAAVWALAKAIAARRWGAAVSFDDGSRPTVDLIADRLHLVGRPDELRRLADGRVVPIELKSRRAPRSGTFRSHRVQVEAYCLLIESSTGRSPPYGVVAYAGGESRTVPWDRAAREEVLGVLAAVRGRYDGRATPSAAKCHGCRWRDGCDARAA